MVTKLPKTTVLFIEGQRKSCQKSTHHVPYKVYKMVSVGPPLEELGHQKRPWGRASFVYPSAGVVSL
jgi:hypothetical protein